MNFVQVDKERWMPLDSATVCQYADCGAGGTGPTKFTASLFKKPVKLRCEICSLILCEKCGLGTALPPNGSGPVPACGRCQLLSKELQKKLAASSASRQSNLVLKNNASFSSSVGGAGNDAASLEAQHQSQKLADHEALQALHNKMIESLIAKYESKLEKQRVDHAAVVEKMTTEHEEELNGLQQTLKLMKSASALDSSPPVSTRNNNNGDESGVAPSSSVSSSVTSSAAASPQSHMPKVERATHELVVEEAKRWKAAAEALETEVADLKQREASAALEKEQLSQQVQDLTITLAARDVAEAQRRNEFENFQRAWALNSSQLVSEIERSGEQASKLQAQLAEVVSDCGAKSEKLRHAMTSLQEGQKAAANAHAIELAALKSEHAGRVRDLEQRIVSAEQKHAEQRTRSAKQAEEAAAQFRQQEEVLSQVRADLSVARQQHFDIASQLEKTTQDLSDAEQKLKETQDHLRGTSDSLSATTQQLAETEQQLEQTRAEATTSLAAARDELDSEKRNLQSQLNEQREVAERLDKELAAATQRHGRESATLQHRIAELSGQLDASQQQLAESNCKIDALEQQLEREHKEQSDARDAASKTQSDLQMQLDATKQQLQTSGEELSAAKAAGEAKQKQLDAVTEQLEAEQQQRAADSELAKKELQALEEALAASRATLDSKIEAVKTEFGDVAYERDQLQNLVRELSEVVAAKEAQLAHDHNHLINRLAEQQKRIWLLEEELASRKIPVPPAPKRESPKKSETVRNSVSDSPQVAP